jgi:predicted dehydrogenase
MTTSDGRPVALRWGIAGTGALSGQIADDLHHLDGAVLHAVASRAGSRAFRFAERHGARHSGTVDEMLLLDDLDVIYVATPPTTHHGIARRAMPAGKSVVVEKPATMDLQEAADLAEVAEATGTFLMEAVWMKFNPAYRELLSVLGSGGIGEVRSVRAGFGLPFPVDTSSRWDARLGGSALFDQGIYPVTLAHDVLGEPIRVTATGTQSAGIDVAQHMTFDYAHGRFAQLASSMTEFADPTASVSGTGGWIHIPFPFWAASDFTVHRADPERFVIDEVVSTQREGNGYVPMLREVQSAVLAGQLQHSWHTWEDTLQVLTLLESIARSIQDQ